MSISISTCPLLSDRRVRQALLLGLDREAISRSLFGGRQPVADSFMNPLDRGFSAETPRYRHDPQRAAALLDEAGWKLRSGGLRGNAAGQALSLELMTTAGNRTRELVEQVLQSQWRKIGVDVRMKNEPARVLFGETMPHRRFDMAMYAWISAPENVPRSISALAARSRARPTGSPARTRRASENAEVDRLIDALEIELDPEKRRAMWAELQRLYATELPSLPLYFRSDAFILPKWLKGVRPTGNQSPSTLWITEWSVQQ